MQKIYTVIHASDKDQIWRNVGRSIGAGADGTFIINHAGIHLDEMLAVIPEIKKIYSEFFIGINPLGVNPEDAFELAQNCGADGLWLDESYIRTFDRDQERYDLALSFMDQNRKLFKGQYFGSVAFKTQGPCKDPVAVAIKAVQHTDVVVTSGAGTGKAPEPEKIASMKAAIGDYPLGIASGVTPDNIKLFPTADVIMVATGVQDTWTELNEEKIRLMVKRKAK